MASSSARRSARTKPKPSQGDAVHVGEEAKSDGAVGSDDEQVKEKEKSEVSRDDEETETEDEAAAKKKNNKKKTTQKSGKKNLNKKKTDNKKKRKKASEEEDQEEDDDGVEEKKKSKKPAKKKHNSRYTWSRCIIFFSPNVCPPSSFLHLVSIFFPGTRGTKRGKGLARSWPAVVVAHLACTMYSHVIVG